ncbi:MAG: hypothetical protein GX890_07940 [Firmicutes bacterium]|jgi:polyhydroxyalkanoate synthesis regulator phasin|nr:hypothetical protein [Bacillota bacterium]HPU00638.1 hypothetical protein [Bacillota bacterium]
MWEDFLSATIGLLVFSKEKAEEFIDMLVEKGEMQRDEAQKLVNRLIEKGKDEKDRLKEQLQQLKEKVDSSWKEKFVSREDLERVERKLDELIALIKDKLT